MLVSSKITALLDDPSLALNLLDTVDSTNDHLKQFVDQQKLPRICITECQTHGKGRHERQWYSPYGDNIYLSILYPWHAELDQLTGLSLVIALSVCDAIEANCKLPQSLTVKWPNDIVAQHKKLGGILIEVVSGAEGQCAVIIGIGVNVNMYQASEDHIDQAWTSLYEITDHYHDRNRLCAGIINQILKDVPKFQKSALDEFMPPWKPRDYLYQRDIKLRSHQTCYQGQGAGINAQGHLVLKFEDGHQQAFSVGEASLLKSMSRID